MYGLVASVSCVNFVTPLMGYLLTHSNSVPVDSRGVWGFAKGARGGSYTESYTNFCNLSCNPKYKTLALWNHC